MKKRIIEKVISSKMFQLISSIEDDKVKELVRDNAIVTGGCIASMLLNEKVNDYDVYFKDKETVLAVANYYAARFNKAQAKVIDVDNLDEREAEYYKSHGIYGTGRVAIYCDQMHQPINDGDEDLIEDLTGVTLRQVDLEEDGPEKFKPLYLSPNAISLSHKVQLILRFYGSPEDIHKNYDYVHATNYWTLKSGLVLNQPALEAILAKELIYIGSKYPLASILRIKKFLLRGWHINAGQQLKIMYQISKLDLNDISVLEDQLVGVDVAYFVHLISALRSSVKSHEEKKETFEISYHYLAEIIDRVFNR